MLSDGAKVKHIKSPNFISEMADSFNVAGLTTAAGSRITLVIGRDQLEITQETMIEVPGLGYRSQTLQEDMVLSRLVLANITIPLDAAKSPCERPSDWN